MKLIKFLFALTMILGIFMQADAALFNRGTDSLGNRLIYDSNLNITWYDYTHSTTDSETWSNHLNWASALTVNLGGSVYDDWRLPTITERENPRAYAYDGSTTYGFNITTSEMGSLFYTELGNKAYYAPDGSSSQPGWGLTNTVPFQHLQPSWYYAGTEDGPWTAVHFHFSTGEQYVAAKLALGGTGGLAMAVRTGDVTRKTIWNVQTDFSGISNPNGAWSYGWESAPGQTFHVYDAAILGFSPNLSWHDSAIPYTGSDYSPLVWKNLSGSLTNGVAPGEVSLHPGINGPHSVIRWTSPVTGTITIAGKFGEGDSGKMSCFIYEDATSLFEVHDTYSDQSFNLIRSVSAGNTIDFIVGESYSFGNTPLHVTIKIPKTDIDDNGIVNLIDFARLATHWLEQGCGTCDGTDLTGDGNVDIPDLYVFSADWLQIPQ